LAIINFGKEILLHFAEDFPVATHDKMMGEGRDMMLGWHLSEKRGNYDWKPAPLKHRAA
jgi:hypothetical protein